jgi:predicted component of type VI protein secretion system
MSLQLEIISDHKDLLGDDHMRLFSESGGTIGRSLENDWILPDPDRFISGRHATVDFQSGAYYLADVSTNGVYLNDDDEPLGKGNPRRLFDGDRLRMGDFEFLVTLDEGQDLELPPDAPMTVVPDHIEQLVPEVSLKSGVQLLDEDELTGDKAFQHAIFGNNAAKKQPVKAESVDNAPNPFAEPEPQEQRTAADLEALLDAFLDGLGIDRAELHPSTDPMEVMTNAGKVLNEFVTGITELLQARASVKSLFRLNQTTVMPRHNNPLKLSKNTRDSIKQLLVGREGEYLGPLDSVKEVCRDLKFHHDALLEGMTHALHEFSDRFDPDELEENFDRTLNKKPLFSGLNQLKYWQLYCDLYPIMTQQGSGRFPQHFGEEFVRTYERLIGEYKRMDRSGSGTASLRAINDDSYEQPDEPVDQVDHRADW